MAVCSRYVLTLSQKVGRHRCRTAAGEAAAVPSSVSREATGEEAAAAERRQPSCATMRQETHFNRWPEMMMKQRN